MATNQIKQQDILDFWKPTIEHILEFEGVLADRKLSDDPGGLTKYGITQKAWTTSGNYGSVAAISRVEAIQWYTQHLLYGTPYLIEIAKELDAPEATAYIADMVVHMGAKRALQMVQIALAVVTQDFTIAIDGKMGRQTRQGLHYVWNEQAYVEFIGALEAARYTYLWTRPHVSNNPGWFRRVLSFIPLFKQKTLKKTNKMGDR